MVNTSSGPSFLPASHVVPRHYGSGAAPAGKLHFRRGMTKNYTFQYSDNYND